MAGRSLSMFGTPPEPLFNNKMCGVTKEMLHEWLEFLLEENNKHVENAQPDAGSCFMGDSVQFLFNICDRMKMSSEVKFLSLEVFDRFMIQHIKDLHQHVLTTSSKKSREKDWHDIMKRVMNQVVLRIVSCVQIASKLTSHYRVLRPHKARVFLAETGHRYNCESILQSELRILKTLGFKVSIPSPLAYMESLLEMLGHTNKEVDVKVLHGVAEKLLDLTYINYSEVYDRLQKLALDGSPISDKHREKFCSVRADKMLLMASLITAATYIVDRTNHEQVIVDLFNITNIPREDITDFASVVLKLLVESSED